MKVQTGCYNNRKLNITQLSRKQVEQNTMKATSISGWNTNQNNHIKNPIVVNNNSFNRMNNNKSYNHHNNVSKQKLNWKNPLNVFRVLSHKEIKNLRYFRESEVPVIEKACMPSVIGYKIYMLISALVILAVSIFIIQFVIERAVAEASYQQLSNDFVTFTVTKEPVKSEQTIPGEEVFPPLVDFKGLQSINNEINGWIYAPDTPINYPLVYSPEANKYLRKDIYGKYSVAGTVFLEHTAPTGNLDSLDHIVLYGHHLNSGNMFTPIHLMKDKEYRDKHRIAYLITPDYVYKLALIGVYTVEPTEVEAAESNFNTHQDFQKYLDTRIARIKDPYDFSRKHAQKLITLVTCTNSGQNREIAEYISIERYPTSFINKTIEAPEDSLNVDAG